MPLQNRVAPNGTLHFSKARGMFTGNRGVIHDPDGKRLLGRRWSTPAWICCSLEWKDRRREVWGRNHKGNSAGWSELFFLDEVTALAAGHRPCHTCRHADAMRFHDAYCAANGKLNSPGKNKILHTERLYSRRTTPETISLNQAKRLPDGSVIRHGETYLAMKDGNLLRWSFEGYYNAHPFKGDDEVYFELVTPRSIIGALKEGYQPVWHFSAS